MSVRIKSWIVAVGLSLLSAAQVLAQDAQAGLKALDAEQISKAKGIFQNLATSAPSAENQFYLGYFFLRTLNAAEAKAAFEKGLSLDPKYALNTVGLGGVALLNKDRANGKAQIDQALASTKNKDEVVLYRAAEMYTLFDETNDPAEAIRLIDLIATLKKKSPNPEYNMVKGDAFFIKNEGGPAVSEYEKAAALDPKMAKAYNMIGRVFKRGKNYSSKTNEGGAQNYFQKAVEADSNYAPAYREYGELWLLVRNYKNAAYNYKKYLQKSEPTPDNILRYAKFAFLSKDYENAVLRLNEIKGKINDPDIQRMYGYSYVELEKYDLGVENLEQLLKVIDEKKQLSSDYGYLGRGYSKMKKGAEALTYLQKAAPLDTNENYYMDIYNIQFTEQKDYKAAAETYKKVIEWKNGKKERVTGNDWLRLGSSYYFASGTFRTAKDTLSMISYAMMADSAITKIDSTTNAIYFLWRARANDVVDVDKTKGLAFPFYARLIERGDKTRKNDMFEAYRYLGIYNLFIKKDDAVGIDMLKKALEYKPDDKYVTDLINQATNPAGTTTPPPPKTPNNGAGGTPPPKSN